MKVCMCKNIPFYWQHSILYMTLCDIILGSVQSLSKPAISTSCKLYAYNASYKTGLLVVQIWRGHFQASVNYSVLIISNG